MILIYLLIGFIIGIITVCIFAYIAIKDDYNYFDEYDYYEGDYYHIWYMVAILFAIILFWPIYIFIIFFLIIIIIIIYFIKKKIKKE